MEPNSRFRSAVRGFYAWIGSMIVLGAAPMVALELIERGTLPARVGAVVLGVGGSAPWLWVVFNIIRRGDEFERRMHLVAGAFAFAGALVLVSAADWLVRAGFLSPPNLMALWVGFLILWLIALLGTKRYFERER
jgi:hypothetical protein